MQKIIVNGAKGRMGSLAVSSIRETSDLSIVGELDIGDNLAEAISRLKPDVVVDLTAASSGFKNAMTIIEGGACPVLGTSGFNEEKAIELETALKKTGKGGIIVPNFSIGAVLMMKYAREIAKYLPDIEIIELHHDKKEDFPSGTAVRTAELIAANRPASSVREADGRGVFISGIPIHSVRLPGYIAHQEVIFGGYGETLMIRHDSIDRKSFMPGVLLSCRKVVEFSGLKYGLEEIL